MGSVSVIPVTQTFDAYLDTKSAAIINRLNATKYPKSTIIRLLFSIAGQMWHDKDTKALHERQWDHAFPHSMTLSDREELLQMLAQEGIIFFQEEIITLDRSFRFVFDELREYLLLRYLLSRLPDHIRQNEDINSIAIATLNHFRPDDKNPEILMLLSLIGLLLPEISERQEFLKLLLNWDFATFCACLAHIPPLGSLNECNTESLRKIGEHLRVWFSPILENVISDDVRTSLNYWEDIHFNKTVVGVKVTASPHCREVSYYYTVRKNNEDNSELVEVNQISGYPTFSLSIGTQNDRIELHNPEDGLIIPSWHTPGVIQRTINSSFPPQFVGESFNVLERMVLYDVMEEIKQTLTDKANRLQLPLPLFEEKQNAREFIRERIDILDDKSLGNYLYDIFVSAISCYMMLVDRYFFKLKNVLNLAAQMPSSFYFITDRSSIKYGFFPVESQEDMKFSFRVMDSRHDITDPEWKVIIHDDEGKHEDKVFEDFVWDALEKMGKLRSPIQPIDKVESISNFLSNTPINDLVDRWLLADFRLIFGF